MALRGSHSSWEAIGAPIEGRVEALALYAGWAAGTVARVTKWNGSSWEAPGPNIASNGQVFTMVGWA